MRETSVLVLFLSGITQCNIVNFIQSRLSVDCTITYVVIFYSNNTYENTGRGLLVYVVVVLVIICSYSF